MIDKLSYVFLPQKIARKVIREGNSWHIILGLEIVLMTAVGFAALITLNGYRYVGIIIGAPDGGSLQTSILTTTIAFMTVWGIVVFWSAMKRSIHFNRPVDIELDAHCLALPFTLLLPGLVILKITLPFIVNTYAFNIYARVLFRTYRQRLLLSLLKCAAGNCLCQLPRRCKNAHYGKRRPRIL